MAEITHKDLSKIVSSDVRESTQINLSVEKRLVRKLDMIVLPILAMIYFTHSLDRANLGNAKTDNLEKDIGLKGNQYSQILIAFYVTYGTFNIPGTVLAKRFSPAVVIPILMFTWGSISLATAAVHNFTGILLARIFLGAAEAGFFPSAIYYFTLFYTRTELAARIGIFYMMGGVANATSGLIAWSVFSWHEKLHNWQYLFIVEGSLTIFLAILAFIVLPRDVASSRYFTNAEKYCSTLRKQKEQETEVFKFSWSATLLPLKDWKVWTYGFMGLCSGVGSATVVNFLPTIIKRLTTNTLRANLFTVAPNLSGAVCVALTCWLSDRTQQRAFFAMGGIAFPLIGFIVLGTADLVHKVAVGYFMTFFLTFGTFTPLVLIPAWLSSNIVSPSGRATTLGLVSGMQNIAGIISSQAFRAQEAPVYSTALIVSGCFDGGMIIAAGTMCLYYRNINQKLDSGELKYVEGMEFNPAFRYIC